MVHNAAVAFPVLPGKTEDEVRSIATMLQSRPDEYRESRANGGVELERVYYMQTPMGDFVIAYLEGTKPIGEALGTPATSGLEIDNEFVRLVKELHGVDLSTPPPGPAPETLANWSDPSVTERRAGLAFTAPILPGADQRGRDFCKEAWGTRVAELQASRRELGVSREVVTLQTTPHGQVVNVYLEGTEPAEGNRKFAASTSAFDVWFKEECRKIFIPEVDFNTPLPPITELFDSQRILVAR